MYLDYNSIGILSNLVREKEVPRKPLLSFNIMSEKFDLLVPHEYIIHVKDDYIQVHSNGVKNLEFISAMWEEVLEACKANHIFKVLGIALTSEPLTKQETQGLLPLFQKLGLDKEYRIAWVELNPKFYERTLMAEDLLSHNGVDAKFFYEVEHARNWLLAKRKDARQNYG